MSEFHTSKHTTTTMTTTTITTITTRLLPLSQTHPQHEYPYRFHTHRYGIAYPLPNHVFSVCILPFHIMHLSGTRLALPPSDALPSNTSPPTLIYRCARKCGISATHASLTQNHVRDLHRPDSEIRPGAFRASPQWSSTSLPKSSIVMDVNIYMGQVALMCVAASAEKLRRLIRWVSLHLHWFAASCNLGHSRVKRYVTSHRNFPIC